jgi:hypothetical protein
MDPRPPKAQWRRRMRPPPLPKVTEKGRPSDDRTDMNVRFPCFSAAALAIEWAGCVLLPSAAARQPQHRWTDRRRCSQSMSWNPRRVES